MEGSFSTYTRINIGQTDEQRMSITITSNIADLGLVRGEDYTK